MAFYVQFHRHVHGGTFQKVFNWNSCATIYVKTTSSQLINFTKCIRNAPEKFLSWNHKGLFGFSQ